MPSIVKYGSLETSQVRDSRESHMPFELLGRNNLSIYHINVTWKLCSLH